MVFELPEMAVLARQLAAEVAGNKVVRCVRGNSPHKFVWYGRDAAEYEAMVEGKVAGEATARGKWIFLPLVPGLVQAFGECGGRLLLHPAGAKLPAKYHLLLQFADGRTLTATTQMWGFYGVMTPEEIAAHKYAGNIRTGPTDAEFTYDYFVRLIGEAADGGRRSAKGLLTQEGLIAGLGNSYCQDILFRAGIHPKRSIAKLDEAERQGLYEAVVAVTREAIAKGGRDDEFDLYGRRGGYVRVMDSEMAGNPCPRCGTTVEKIQYLGGACYFCPECQR